MLHAVLRRQLERMYRGTQRNARLWKRETEMPFLPEPAKGFPIVAATTKSGKRAAGCDAKRLASLGGGQSVSSASRYIRFTGGGSEAEKFKTRGVVHAECRMQYCQTQGENVPSSDEEHMTALLFVQKQELKTLVSGLSMH